MSRFPRRNKIFYSLQALFLALPGCGDSAQFGGNSAAEQSANVTRDAPPPTPPPAAKPDEPAPEPTPDIAVRKAYQSMSWLWQCQNSPTPPPKPANETEVIVSGKGPFEFNEEELKGTKVTFSGTICPPDNQPRDIVFVIDTSLSMEDNDPVVGESCGRLKAVQGVISAIPTGSARFGLVTFNSVTAMSTTRLYDSGQALFAAVAQGKSVADVLCLADGTTNYDSGLTPASQILATGRPNSSKEIYFISDGRPNDGDGLALSQSLKSTGVNVSGRNIPVTIGTIMLVSQQDDQALKVLASTAQDGKLLHAFVAQAQDLAKTLSDLVANKIVSATLKYRLIGESQFTSVNIMDHLKGLNFTLPSMAFPIKNGVPGLEVVYEYVDKLGQKFTSTGKVLLKVTTSSTPP
jgi:hypothetical protein